MTVVNPEMVCLLMYKKERHGEGGYTIQEKVLPLLPQLYTSRALWSTYTAVTQPHTHTVWHKTFEGEEFHGFGATRECFLHEIGHALPTYDRF